MTDLTYPLTYMVTSTRSGDWYYAANNNFTFTYVEKSEPSASDIVEAFKETLSLSGTIKDAAAASSGRPVVDGLYLVDANSMATVMNSIPGMGQTGTKPKTQKGEGTAEKINEEFFTAAMGGLGGGVSPIQYYLDAAMRKIQEQIKKNKLPVDSFGTLIGIVSTVPLLRVIVTTFHYIVCSAETAETITKFICGSPEAYSYDFTYTITSYNYSKSS